MCLRRALARNLAGSHSVEIEQLGRIELSLGLVSFTE
jgi:hypothetical protein